MRYVGWIASAFALVVILSVVGFTCQSCNTAKQVLYEQTNARALLTKYEWFKDASAQLDKKTADIQVYKAKLKRANERADEVAKVKGTIDRTQSEQISLWETEVAGIISSYNELAAEYNSQMAKINWRFCNIGTLPAGATTPLPREYKPYVTE